MKLFITLSAIIMLSLCASLEAQKISLEEIKEFKLPAGYDCNLLDVVKEEIVITCPGTLTIFHSEQGEDFKEIPYKLGRGPGELNRAPFGIGILKDHIVFSDPDLQRILIYDKKNESFIVKRIKLKNGLTYTYSTDNDSLFFIAHNGLEDLGNTYNFYEEKLSSPFLLEEPFKSSFLNDGSIEIQGDKLVFGSYHEGYVSIWDINTQQQMKKYQLFENKDLKERSARMNGRLGSIPPNSENKIEGISLYNKKDGGLLILTLINSRTGEYNLDRLYVFDTEKKRFESKINLEAEADMFEISGDYLYVHYEEKDKLVKYKLVEK